MIQYVILGAVGLVEAGLGLGEVAVDFAENFFLFPLGLLEFATDLVAEAIGVGQGVGELVQGPSGVVLAFLGLAGLEVAEVLRGAFGGLGVLPGEYGIRLIGMGGLFQGHADGGTHATGGASANGVDNHQARTGLCF